VGAEAAGLFLMPRPAVGSSIASHGGTLRRPIHSLAGWESVESFEGTLLGDERDAGRPKLQSLFRSSLGELGRGTSVGWSTCHDV